MSAEGGGGDNTKSSDLPYSCEYAKSGRAGCKKCKTNIGQGTLRLSRKTRSPFFDGFQDNWYHFDCFWAVIKSLKLKMGEGDFRGMDWIKWDDQERIRKKIDALDLVAGQDDTDMKTWQAELAKTSRTKCKQCSVAIKKGESKVGTTKPACWYHIQCLVDNNIKLAAPDCKTIIGLVDLPKEDQELLQSKLQPPAPKPAAKRTANGHADDAPAPKLAKTDSQRMSKLKTQANDMWKLREELMAEVHGKDHKLLLTNNAQELPTGADRVLDRLVDCIMFGVLQPCPVCTHGQLVYSTSHETYKCTGHISAYTRCDHSTRTPGRKSLIVSNDFDENPWLVKLRKTLSKQKDFRQRVYADRKSLVASQSQNSEDVIPDSLYSRPGKSKAKSSLISSKSKSTKMTVKGGTAIDADCEVAAVAHVYKSTQLWSAVLGKFQKEANKNSFYKLQLLEHDHKKKFWLYRAWGRIGSTQGGTKCDKMDLDEAKDEFKRLFEEKTGNKWSSVAANKFVPQPGFLHLIETDYTEADKESLVSENIKPGSRSSLPQPVVSLLNMIFDIEQMKKTMKEFEIDLDRMPLGRLSKKQIASAYQVLTSAAQLMATGDTSQIDRNMIRDVTNRFYTLIPNDHGLASPPLLDSHEKLKEKLDMLDSLRDIEIAYNMIKGDNSGTEMQVDPVDSHYKQLKTQLKPVHKDTDTFQLINTYLKNTHGDTHYLDLDLVELFEVEREGETNRFQPFAADANRQLLWHGSRTSNYAGILSQGLRIAPPEAPSTGYMFGKGVYFADMVTKSANYCHVPADQDGILLLCEVALGNMQERTAAHMVTKLDTQYLSTKGVGRSFPDPSQMEALPDGCKVPLGKPKTNQKQTSLLYNEFIVYNESQVRIRYLLRTKFAHKSFV